MDDEIKPIYSGSIDDFVWVGLGSGSGTNLRECAKVIKPALVFSNKIGAGLFQHKELAESEGIEHKLIPSIGYKGRREEYDTKILQQLREFEERTEKKIDLIVLGGYMRIVSDVLLSAFPDKIINVHPAALHLISGGKRILIGEDAVYDAIMRGHAHTRSSVIMVDSGVDHGEILTQGPELYVPNEIRDAGSATIREYVDRSGTGHQARQKEVSDWPALTAALRLIAEGRLALGKQKYWLNEWRRVYLDKKPLDYHGHRL